MNKWKLNKEERKIEKALLRGDLKPASRAEFDRVAKAIARRRKDAVISPQVSVRRP